MVTVVQAVPGADVGVWVDDRQVAESAAVGAVLGPFRSPRHPRGRVRGGDPPSSHGRRPGGRRQRRRAAPPGRGRRRPGRPRLQRPAGRDRARQGPGPGRPHRHGRSGRREGRRRDGLHHIANGEFADADVPAGTIEVALLPSGTTGDPILGPLDVTLEAGTLSMIYAYGNPRNGSMNVIAHTATLAPDGTVRPSRIDTGSAGLATVPVAEIPAPGPDGRRARPPVATRHSPSWSRRSSSAPVGTALAHRTARRDDPRRDRGGDRRRHLAHLGVGMRRNSLRREVAPSHAAPTTTLPRPWDSAPALPGCSRSPCSVGHHRRGTAPRDPPEWPLGADPRRRHDDGGRARRA